MPTVPRCAALRAWCPLSHRRLHVQSPSERAQCERQRPQPRWPCAKQCPTRSRHITELGAHPIAQCVPVDAPWQADRVRDARRGRDARATLNGNVLHVLCGHTIAAHVHHSIDALHFDAHHSIASRNAPHPDARLDIRVRQPEAPSSGVLRTCHRSACASHHAPSCTTPIPEAPMRRRHCPSGALCMPHALRNPPSAHQGASASHGTMQGRTITLSCPSRSPIGASVRPPIECIARAPVKPFAIHLRPPLAHTALRPTRCHCHSAIPNAPHTARPNASMVELHTRASAARQRTACGTARWHCPLPHPAMQPHVCAQHAHRRAHGAWMHTRVPHRAMPHRIAPSRHRTAWLPHLTPS
jgi:hypothetical protein